MLSWCCRWHEWFNFALKLDLWLGFMVPFVVYHVSEGNGLRLSSNRGCWHEFYRLWISISSSLVKIFLGVFIAAS